MTRRSAGADVVVVGSGAGGCVVARRLAEDSKRSVVLVEAGPDLRFAPPPDFADGWLLPKGFDWGLESEPDGDGGTQPIRRMRAVGGTSSDASAMTFWAWSRKQPVCSGVQTMTRLGTSPVSRQRATRSCVQISGLGLFPDANST